MIVARTRSFNEPRFVRRHRLVGNADTGSNRVEFIIKQCSTSGKRDPSVAFFCGRVQLCGDSGVRDESGHRGSSKPTKVDEDVAAKDVVVDANSCPLHGKPGALASCLTDATPCDRSVCNCVNGVIPDICGGDEYPVCP